MRSVEDVSDVEFHQITKGVIDLDQLKEIFEKEGVLEQGLITDDEFASWFAYELEMYINYDEDSPEYQKLYDDNYSLGMQIARKINQILKA